MQITEEDCSFLTAEKVKQILVFRRDLYCLSGRRRSMSRGRWGRIYRPGDRGLTNWRRGEGAGAEVVGVAAAGVFALLAAEKIPLALGLDGRLAVWVVGESRSLRHDVSARSQNRQQDA